MIVLEFWADIGIISVHFSTNIGTDPLMAINFVNPALNVDPGVLRSFLPDKYLVAYKARPLNGVWATAPFLHNGSVSSLYQLLLPDTEREESFDVGGKDFDVKNVGFLSSETGNRFRFNTLDSAGKPIPGNSNSGHSGNLYTATRAEDEAWRNFTDEERYQLIEYMKTL